MIKKQNGNYRTESALYGTGENAGKFLTGRQFERIGRDNKSLFDMSFNKAKPVKPKEEPKPPPALVEGDT